MVYLLFLPSEFVGFALTVAASVFARIAVGISVIALVRGVAVDEVFERHAAVFIFVHLPEFFIVADIVGGRHNVCIEIELSIDGIGEISVEVDLMLDVSHVFDCVIGKSDAVFATGEHEDREVVEGDEATAAGLYLFYDEGFVADVLNVVCDIEDFALDDGIVMAVRVGDEDFGGIKFLLLAGGQERGDEGKGDEGIFHISGDWRIVECGLEFSWGRLGFLR